MSRSASPSVSDIPANVVPFKEMEFTSEERKALTAFRASIHSALSSGTSPSSPYHQYLASSPSLHIHWWTLFSTVISHRRLQKRREITDLLDDNKKQVNGDDSKLRAEEYEIDKKYSDWDLLRFLRARKMHETDALKMFLTYIKWRYDLGLASLNLLTDMPFRDLLMAVSPHMWHGVAKDGAPIYITNVGEVDAHSFSSITSKEMMTICHAWDMEAFVRRLHRRSAEDGHRVSQLIFLMEFDGVSLSHAKCASAFKVTAEIDQNYYPELLRSMIFVNVPSFFPVLWSLCKAFLDKKTQAKMQMFSASQHSKLLDIAAADQLPIEWGGNGQCSCKRPNDTKFCVPRRAPLGFWEFTVKKHNADDGLELDESMPETKKVVLKARKKYEIVFSLIPGPEEKEKEKEEKNEQVKIEWEFEIKHHDIQFSAEFISDYNIKTEEQTEVPTSPSSPRAKSPSVPNPDEEEAKEEESRSASGSVSNQTAVTTVNAVLYPDERIPDHLMIHAAKRVSGKHRGQFLMPLRTFGTIRFIFSNEYSRWNSKEVQLKITRSTVAVASS